MIKLTSVYPFENFMRVTTEFCEDKVVMNTKSLISEGEFEFEYEEITDITCEKNTSENQMSFGFGLLAITGLIFAFFFTISFYNPTLFRVLQVLYVIASILFFTSFVKSKYYYFIGENNKSLFAIKMTRKNQNLLNNAIELVKSKSRIVFETTPDKPFPDIKPVFEFVEYDTPDYFQKYITRFYENELVRLNKNMLGESILKVKYIQLSGKIIRFKHGNNSWNSAFFITLAFACIIAGFNIAFNILPREYFLIVESILGLFLAIFFSMRFVKQEIIAFHDKNNDVGYAMRIAKSNMEQAEKIIEFIQSKIPAENKV